MNQRAKPSMHVTGLDDGEEGDDLTELEVHEIVDEVLTESIEATVSPTPENIRQRRTRDLCCANFVCISVPLVAFLSVLAPLAYRAAVFGKVLSTGDVAIGYFFRQRYLYFDMPPPEYILQAYERGSGGVPYFLSALLEDPGEPPISVYKLSSTRIIGSTNCDISFGTRVPSAKIDDNFCDCLDSRDEQFTSACSGADSAYKFACVGSIVNKTIANSMVHDGVCDCCDGSDEWGDPTRRTVEKHERGVASISCPQNTCVAEARARIKELMREADTQRSGNDLRTSPVYVEAVRRTISELRGTTPILEKKAYESQKQFKAFQQQFASSPKYLQSLQAHQYLQVAHREM